MKRSPEEGFTLLEVLIAFALVSTLLIGTVAITSQLHNNTNHIQKKLAADLAARNLMDRYRLPLQATQRPKPLMENGGIEMGPYTFAYEQRVLPTAQSELQKITITILDAQTKTQLRQLSMYIATP